MPAPGDTFQIQLSDYPPKMDINADVIALDLYETPPAMIEYFHANGKKVICYINVGAWEEYRSDARLFSRGVIGNAYDGWEGEFWLDISRYEIFADLISARFDLAASKGCDGIDADNINGYQQNTGFEISFDDQVVYNLWIATLAHKRGMSIGLKNNHSQLDKLIDSFDYAIIEDCAVFGECGWYAPFIQQGKAVFQIEYTDRFASAADFCVQSRQNGYSAVLKNRLLGAWVEPCGYDY
jgi:hypothetical protein